MHTHSNHCKQDGKDSPHLPHLRSVYRQMGSVPSWVVVMNRPGITMSDHIENGGLPFSTRQIQHIFAGLFRGLAALHEMSVCHCASTKAF